MSTAIWEEDKVSFHLKSCFCRMECYKTAIIMLVDSKGKQHPSTLNSVLLKFFGIAYKEKLVWYNHPLNLIYAVDAPT